MLSYHLGVSCFQVQRLTATGAAATKAVAAGALFVHAPLTIAFGVAAAWCAARVNLS
jgi:ABC-type sulfate transport system permease subunit